jgi:hypothetical protein
MYENFIVKSSIESKDREGAGWLFYSFWFGIGIEGAVKVPDSGV